MSDYIPAGGYNNYGSTQQRPPLKSVYYPPQPQPSQQQLNPYPQGSQQQYPQGIQQQQLNQLPQGQQQNRPVPALNKIETAPGVKLVSFQQDVTASFPPQFQQQLQQLQQKQQLPQQSVYMGMPNDLYLVSSRPQDYHYPTQRQESNASLMGTAGGYNNYGTTQQQQYQPLQQQQSRQQLNQYPQVAAQQLPPGAVLVINTVGGQGTAKAVPFQQGIAAPIPPQFQQQFGQQPQQESVYIGMPNDLYLASNRPHHYHFQPQRQESNIRTARENESATNLMRTARGSASGTHLRVIQSDDNIRTAILNQDGNVVGILEQRTYPNQAAAQQQHGHGQSQQQAVGGGTGATLQGASSDYHFDALRGLNSAY